MTAAAAPALGRSAPVPAAIAEARITVVLIYLALAAIGIIVPFTGPGMLLRAPTLPMLFKQDLPLLPVYCGVALLLLRPVLAGPGPRPALLPPASDRWWPYAAAVAILLICWWGHRAVLAGWDLSRDEQMANFDAAVFAKGLLLHPVPAEWRELYGSFNRLFLLPIGDREAWISAYLPVNALLRALVGMVADPALTAPLLVALGFLALWRIARRLWPESPGSRAAALICYAGSSQILITGMTAYAMSAHLALNLVWLALFLRDDRAAFAGAVLVGFLATGIHQPLFHPLFVLPFLWLLAREQRWRRLAGYLAAYAVIGLFWLAWPNWVAAQATTQATTVIDGESVGYVTRLLDNLKLVSIESLWLTAANLLRFATWQHLFLLPLLALGCRIGWRHDPMVRALAIGLALPIAAMALLLPWQGHGWGYRYVHGVLGNACLLAGFGWRWIEEQDLDLTRPMAWATGLSLALVLPLHAWMAHAMSAPIAALDAEIRRLPAEIVILDTAPFVGDLAINRADLANRPVRLVGASLSQHDMGKLCARGSVAFLDAPVLGGLGRAYDWRVPARPTAHQIHLKAAARRAGCRIL